MAKSNDVVGASAVGGVTCFSSKNRISPARDACARSGVAGWGKGAGFCVAVSVLMVLAAAGCGREGEREAEGAPRQITMAVQPAPYSGLIAVAEERDFFKKAGLEPRIKLYPSGIDSLKALVQGEAQFATVSDIAFASTMAEDPSLRIIAAIGSSTGSQIVARKDRNICEPGDLKGKKVGYTPGNSSHYFLHSFLLTHHISQGEISMVAIPPARHVEAIASGEVDAVSAFDVYAYAARKKLGGNAVAWDTQNTLDYQWLLVTKGSGKESQEAVQRLLKSLIMAEEFAVNHGEETREIVARKWNIEADYVRDAWHKSRLFVSFNQSIVTALQSYVKWNMAGEGVSGTAPDVLSFMDAGPLERVDPKLVTIFK